MPVLDRAGEVRHVDGATPVPGLYVVGMRLQSRRSSTFLDGVRHDAATVAGRVHDRLRDRARPAAQPAGRGRGRAGAARMTAAWDVVVVGGRVAGAATALLLARAGLRVLCLDRARHGSDTLSTHALMRAGVLQLQRWGLLDPIVAAGTPAVRRTVFHYGDDAVTGDDQAGAGVDALYAPRRTVLDAVLVDAAVDAGAGVRFGTAVTGLLRDGARPGHRGHRPRPRRRRPDGAGRPRRRRRRRPVARRRRRRAPVEVSGSRAGAFIYGYWAGLPVDGYEWFYRPGRQRRRHPHQRRPDLRVRRRDPGPAPRALVRAGGVGGAFAAARRGRRRRGCAAAAVGDPAVCATSAACRGTCAAPGAAAGRSSATPGTGRTR